MAYTPGPAIDPQMLMAMMNYQVAPGAPVSPALDSDAYKDQNQWLTGASKYGNLTTDLDYQLATGGLQPGAFDPVTTLDPVDAPGYRLLESYKTGTPFQQYVATMWEKGNKGSMEILADLQNMIAKPSDDPFAQQVIASLPRNQIPVIDPATRQPTGEYTQGTSPDMKSVADALQKFETTVLSDPEHTIVDGQPVSATTEDSPARKAALEAGFVSDPGATYDPWAFAPQGAREAEEALPGQFSEAATESATNNALMKKARREAYDAAQTYRRYLGAQDEQQASNRLHGSGGGIPWEVRGVPGQPTGSAAGGGGGPASREAIPQRGGWADDLGRIAEHPGASIFGALQDLPGDITRIPGALDNVIGDPVASAAGAADRAVGDPTERFLAGQQGINLDESYLNDDTNTFRMPDWLTGNTGGPAAGGTTRTGTGRARPLNAGLAGGGAVQSSIIQSLLGPQLQNAARQNTSRGLERRQGAAHAQAVKARDTNNASRQKMKDAGYAASQASIAQAQRQAFVDYLTSQNRTPFQDEVNQRNAAYYGMGR